MSSIHKKLLFIFLLSITALYVVTPTFIYFSLPKEIRNDSEEFLSYLPSWLPQKHIKLGLDLQGGVQLVLGVDTDTAVKNKLGRIATEMSRFANEDKKQVKQAFVVKGTQTLRIELEDGIDPGELKADLFEEFQGLTERERTDNSIDLIYDDTQLQDIKKAALNQAEKVVRNRVDKWGVTEPSISRRIDGTILVQLPGFKDPSKARELLGKTAQLKFKLLNEESKAFAGLLDKLPEGVTYERRGNFDAISFIAESKQPILDLTKGSVPQNSELLFEVQPIAGGKKSQFISHLVFATNELSGEDILDANVTIDSGSLDQRPAVSLKFTGPGGKRFGEITGENVQKRMAIVLDNMVVSDPVIQTKIATGEAQITLGSGKTYNEQIEEAQGLALVLKSGALPAPITILEERQVGATLGPELANQGVLSVVAGLVLVLAFMSIVYKRPGLISCLSLFLNGVLLLAGMALFGFSLTLPGFAGLILTLGMGVDANVLINERIRQELREGKFGRKAVENAFAKVFWTIIDANVTTLIAALVLLETNSSGPIKGFSVALILGLMVSMFTALYCTKVFFLWVSAEKRDHHSIKAWLGDKDAQKPRLFGLDVLKHGPKTVVLGVVLAIAVIGSGAATGINWAVDFAGGTEVEMTFQKSVSGDEIRNVLKEGNIDSATLQTIGNEKNHYLIRFEKSIEEQKEAVQSLLTKGLQDFGPDLQRIDFVGPLIGKELRSQGIMSVGLALIGILIYIGLRFDMRFGPGAILKMIQDVFVVVGFYVFFQRSFDLTSVAALLTAIGYSVNDTIVVYDRIRENLQQYPRRSLYDNINYSVNETLTRTINTSLTTIVALVGILFFASAQIWNFAAAMVIGVISATFTSNFLATWILLKMERWRKDQAVAKATAR